MSELENTTVREELPAVDSPVDVAAESLPSSGDSPVDVAGADLPSLDDLQAALSQAKGKRRFRRVLAAILGTLLVLAAIAALLSARFFPVLQIYGDSMAPTLNEGDFVVAMETGEFESGDIVAFYFEDRVLVKRVIATAGDWVNIAEDGTVSVNEVAIEEPYLEELALGNCNIELPYQVPESHVFLMGDHRSVSIDSRNTAVGSIAEEQIIGKLLVSIWPLESVGVL